MRIRLALVGAFQALGIVAAAAVVPVSPIDGETVALLPEAQKKIMSLATYEERLAALKADKAKPRDERCYFRDRESKWRTSAPLTLKWQTTDGEKGPWKILIGTSPDFANARELWPNPEETRKMTMSGDSSMSETAQGDVRCYTYNVPRPNLELGRTYYWKIWSDVKCRNYSHGSTLKAACPCGRGRMAVASQTASFTTEDIPPRWIMLEGKAGNIRDLGGWKTLDGRRVRQGLIYRGTGLNASSVNGDRIGRNRLTVEDVSYMKEDLGIKTDLDLRTKRELAGMVKSPLGDGVTFIHQPSPAYRGLFAAGGFDSELCPDARKATAENFRVFCERANYPIYFHCIGGADRTGSLSYILCGVLGVSKHDAEVEWEVTFYPELPEMTKDYAGPNSWRTKLHFDEGFGKYGDADTPLQRRIELYLLDCGVTKAEIDRFRSIMLEPL